MKTIVLPFLAAATLVSLGQLGQAQAADAEAKPDSDAVSFNLAGFLGITNLTIAPKVISRTDGGDTTYGLDYKYDRRIQTLLEWRRTELDFSIHSEGLIVADSEKSPNRLLKHGIRFSLIDILPSTRINSPSAESKRALIANVFDDLFTPWFDNFEKRKEATSQEEKDELLAQMDSIAAKADVQLGPYGTFTADNQKGRWYLSQPTGTGRTNTQEWIDKLREGVLKPRLLFLSWDLDGDAETDQTFDDVQFVGSTQLRGKFLMPWFDYPFALLRGYRTPKSHLNRNTGPYFWGGVGLVDPSNNDSRKTLTSDDDVYPRAHVGVQFRTELFALDSKKAVALELSWRYYHEFDAPAGIKNAGLNDTHYFKGAVLFPGNLFIEYTDGKLPLDVQNSTTLSGGWRYNF